MYREVLYMSSIIDVLNIINGLSTNIKVFIIIIIAALFLTKLTPGEKHSWISMGNFKEIDISSK